MFVQVRRNTVRKGYAEKAVERFLQSISSVLEKQPGFVEVKVMVKKARRNEEDEVMILIFWESEEYWKQWEKSEVHIAMHKASRGKPKPEYMLHSEVGHYELQAEKTASTV